MFSRQSLEFFMNKTFRFVIFSLLVSCLSLSVNAFQLEKPIAAKITAAPEEGVHGAGVNNKDVYLMKLKLSSREKAALFGFKPKKGFHEISMLPAATNIGMNGVPVLDQGMHGACATFANTALIDAALGRGDHVSQLCQLELGAYLEKDSYMPSGWDGTVGPWVLDQMFRFGVVSKTKQRMRGCAGFRYYPTYSQSQGSPMSEDDFKVLSEDITKLLDPVFLLDFNQRFSSSFTPEKAEQIFNQTKELLASGNRLTVGVVLVITDSCSVGACAMHHVPLDTWAVTKELDIPGAETAGHEMVIMGYDDEGVAVDAEGNTHTGLFILRNSWSSAAGDHGNYYMTYEYFKKFAGELQAVIPVKD